MNAFVAVLNVFTFLAQTETQKKMTLMNIGCLAVFFLILVIDKCAYSSKKETPIKTILLVFAAIFIVFFLILFFFGK